MTVVGFKPANAKQRRYARRKGERAEVTMETVRHAVTGWGVDQKGRFVAPDLKAKERRYFKRHRKVLEDQLAKEFEEIYRADTQRSMDKAMERQVASVFGIPQQMVQYSSPGLVLHPRDYDDIVRAEAVINGRRISHEALYRAGAGAVHVGTDGNAYMTSQHISG